MFELGQVVHSLEVAVAGVAHGAVYHGQQHDVLTSRNFRAYMLSLKLADHTEISALYPLGV